MLNYCGAVVLEKILPSHYYRHFLLLVFANHILNNKELIADSTDYANNLLKKFFDLLPSLYRIGSQVLSWHNIIHVADDAKHFKIPLKDLSGFWGENYIGLFKKFIKLLKNVDKFYIEKYPKKENQSKIYYYLISRLLFLNVFYGRKCNDFNLWTEIKSKIRTVYSNKKCLSF